MPRSAASPTARSRASRSRVGAVEVAVEITPDIQPGVVSLPHGWGHGRAGVRLAIASAHAGVSINDLIDDQPHRCADGHGGTERHAGRSRRCSLKHSFGDTPMLKSMIAAALAMLMAGAAAAQAPAEVVFRNVRVFDGKSDRLTAPTSVLVRGNLHCRDWTCRRRVCAHRHRRRGRRPHPDAGADRRALAHDADSPAPPNRRSTAMSDLPIFWRARKRRATLMRGFTSGAGPGRSELRLEAGH